MKILIRILIFIILSSCQPGVEQQREHLEGYWEIRQATLPEGISKEFGVSQLVDRIEVHGDSGYRIKLRPRFDGHFTRTGTKEDFSILAKEDSLVLQYHTPFDQWRETVLQATADKLVLQNEDGIIYTYNRFEPYDIQNE